MARSRASGIVACVFVGPTACALTQAGTVMATKNETESETGRDEAKEGGAAPSAKRGWLSRKLIIIESSKAEIEVRFLNLLQFESEQFLIPVGPSHGPVHH